MLAGGGPLDGDLKQLTHRLGIRERVHFLGNRDDIPNLLGIADIYVQPSRDEGFGIAALEAMAAGVPVVVSALPALSEVVGSAALQFQAGNEKELAQCVMKLLADAGLRRQLSCQGRQRAARFSIDQTVREHLSLYETILQAGGRAGGPLNRWS
jgi:glycosyltransferase involved in cell wall biosynthesis